VVVVVEGLATDEAGGGHSAHIPNLVIFSPPVTPPPVQVLGAEFAPALAFGRLAIAASFVAEVPLVYRPNRRKWKFEKEFGIRLLECR
jgi:hypothetical protein